jgi:hypothetical protein
MDERFRSFPSSSQWTSAWEGRAPRFQWPARRAKRSPFQDIAHYVGGALSVVGFQLFQNGGLPLIERRVGTYRQEILLTPAPRMDQRVETPFCVRIHLSNTELARVRSIYWKPPTRAPQSVAAGDLGQLAPQPCHLIWHGNGELETATRIIELLHRDVLPWFDIFLQPSRLRERIYTRSLCLVDDCTALELLLAEFDPFEARSFVTLRLQSVMEHVGPVGVAEGFDLQQDRVHAVAAYYHLR